MKILITLFVAVVTTASLHAQKNCFETCMEQLKDSKPPEDFEKWAEERDKVIDQLIGCHAPDFKVKSITGNELSLKELKGKIVVINFWFTSCAPCIAEIPALNKLVEAYKEKDVVFIAFGREDVASLNEFIGKTKFNYNIVASDQQFAERYCLMSGWPMNMVLDKNGIARQIFSGGWVDERAKTGAYDKMKPTIDKYLAEK